MAILKKIKVPGLIALLAFGLFFSQRLQAQPGYSVPVESFYNELAPYGQWVQYPGYGNAWLPNADPDFQPYATGGHWVMTEYGNTWVSDYDWGWATFHYGRWIYDPAYGGWLWIPGSDWAPAWVSWRSGGGYYGWAPLGPGVDININIPAPYWTFVPQVYITSPRLYGYYVPRTRLVTIYQNTTIINNVYRSTNWAYNYGPPRRDLERITRQNIPVYRIEPMNRPGRSVIGNGSVGFYRPGADRSRLNGNGQNYGRNDRYSNGSRPDYNGANGSNRGYYGGPASNTDRAYNPNAQNREYTGNGNPNRNYEGSYNNSSRGSYGGVQSAERNGSYNPSPVPDQQSSNRFERSRGTYSPGSAQPSPSPSVSTPQPPNRSYDRAERQAPANEPFGGRRGGDFNRMPEGRSAPQAQPQAQSPSRGLGGGMNGHQRGPR